MADEAAQTGRLELPVVADASGFREDLRAKIERASEGLEARIGITLNSEGLRERLKAVVDEAAAGVEAKVTVKVDDKKARRSLRDLLRRGGNVDVNVGSKGGVIDDVVRASAEAQAVADADPVKVPVEGKNKLRGRLARWLLEARMEAAAGKVEVPVEVKAPKGRALFRGILIGSLISLIEPIVSVLGGAVAGLVALGGPLGQVVGSLGSAVPLLGALAGIGITGFLAFGGFAKGVGALVQQQQALANGTKLTKAQQAKLNAEIAKMGPEAGRVAKQLIGVFDKLKGYRKGIQNALFGEISNRNIKGLGDIAKLVKPNLTGIAKSMGHQLNQLLFDLRKTIGPNLNKVFGFTDEFVNGAGAGLRAFFRGMSVFAAAAAPILERLGDAIFHIATRFEHFVNGKAAGGKDNRILAFLNRAADRVTQFGGIIFNLAKGFGGIFKGAMGAGNTLMASLSKNAEKFARWANDPKTQKKLDKYFKDQLPTFYEVIGLIGDIGKSLFKLAQDKNTPKMIKQIREQLLPALTDFLLTLGQVLGPKVIDLLSTVLTIFSNLGGAGGGIADVVTILNTLATALNNLLNVKLGPGKTLGDYLGKLLGIFIAYKAAKGVGKYLGLAGLASGLASLGTGAVAKGLSVLARLVGLGGLGKVLGDFAGGVGGKGGSGKGGAAGGGLKDTFKNLFGKRMEVYWKVPQVVRVLGGGLGSDLDPTGGGGGVDEHGKPKKPPTRVSRAGRAVASAAAVVGTTVAVKVAIDDATDAAVGGHIQKQIDKRYTKLQQDVKNFIDRYNSSPVQYKNDKQFKEVTADRKRAVQDDSVGQSYLHNGKRTGGVDLVKSYDFLVKYNDKSKETQALIRQLATDPTVATALAKRDQGNKAAIAALTTDYLKGGKKAGQNFNTSLTSLLLGNAGPISSAGAKTGDAAANGVKSKGSVAGLGFVSTLASQLRNGIGAAAQIAIITGQGIADGVVTGIQSRIKNTVAYAKSAGEAAANAVRHGADVNSPSRITHYVGQMISEGLGAGVRSNLQKQLTAARHAGRKVAHATNVGAGSAFNAASLRAGASRLINAPAASGPAALVGRDLVLRTDPTDPVTALQNAVFELRRIAKGGVHNV